MPKGSRFLLIAAWLLLAEGGLGIVFSPVIVFSTPSNVGPSRILMFNVCAVATLAAGALLYSRWAWSWWLALATAIGVAAWLIATGGLRFEAEGYGAAGFAVAVALLLTLGRRAAGRPEALAISSANIPFRLKVAMVWVAIFIMIAIFLALSDLDTEWIRDNFFFIINGIQFTLFLAVGAIILAVILALFGALGRISKNPLAYGLSGFYTSFFRGTPLIVQLFLIYTALPQIGGNLERLSLVNILTLTGFQAGVIGLGLNYGAYMTEIFRAGIQSVGHGQAEAADALGMNYAQRMRRVVLPQATRVIIPPTGNEFIAMMKDTALVSFLGVEVARAELFLRARLAGEADLRKLEALIVAAGMYWTLTAIFTFFQRKLERRMGRGYERGAPAPGATRPKLLTLGGTRGQPGIPPVVETEPAIVDMPPADRGPV